MRHTDVARVAAGLVISAALHACGKEAPPGEAGAAESGTGWSHATPVQIDTVRQGTLVLGVSATGQSLASRETAIAAGVAGRVAALPYSEGDRVPPRAPLLRLEADAYALAARQAEAELEEARARFREMTLFDERIEDESVRRERAEAARARSGLARAEVALERARHDLAQATVVAPFAGFVADVTASPGEYVGAGQEVLTLVALDPIRVDVQVPESELRWLGTGDTVGVRFPALPDQELRGTVATINPVVDPGSRTGRVTLAVGNPAGTVRPGMYARVTLSGRSFPDRVTVPRDAVLERDGRSLIFLFQPIPDAPGLGLARWVYVTPGIANAQAVELLANDETPLPEPGAAVIVDGNYTLVHDARVRLAEPERRSDRARGVGD